MFALFPRLKERLDQRGGTLSGGEQQMLAIARALMSRPRLLLLDEPSLGLAPLIARQIFDAIRELNVEEKLTVFLVEQNAFHALKLAHRGYVMVNGRITLSRHRPRAAGAAGGEGGLSRRREALMDISASRFPNSLPTSVRFGVFLLVTVVLGGGAAWLAGRAIAATWRPWWHVVVLHAAAWRSPCASSTSRCSAADCCRCTIIWSTTAVCLISGLLGFRMTRVRQMVTCYTLDQ